MEMSAHELEQMCVREAAAESLPRSEGLPTSQESGAWSSNHEKFSTYTGPPGVGSDGTNRGD